MSKRIKSEQDILNKFGVEKLNPMQHDAKETIQSNSDVVLLSPTGTGKTLAFLLPIIASLDADIPEVQTLVIVPTRELAIQIEQVARKMGTGFKVNSIYGGRSGTLDKIDIKHRPALLIGTPGRIADRLRRESFPLEFIKTLVLDEFDKSLEAGFEKEMKGIIEMLPKLNKRVLTSATHEIKIPRFVGIKDAVYIDYLDEASSRLIIKSILTPNKDKLEALKQTLAHIGAQPGIVFCSFKDALQRISDFLTEHKIGHSCFHGDMEQIDRERALVKFRNGTNRLLVATDLAARGLDIPEIKYILHYHLPPREKEFIHRNGRTARMKRDGIAYVLLWKGEISPEYIQQLDPEVIMAEELKPSEQAKPPQWNTLYISGGRRDKISKADIAGLFLKQGQLKKEQLGLIELSQNCAFAGVDASEADKLIGLTNNTKLKKKKVRVSLI